MDSEDIEFVYKEHSPATPDFVEGPSKVPEYTFSYPVLMEVQIKKLRHSLENWKEVALPIKSVLLWEQKWHAPALIAVNTILFTMFWLASPSIVTIISVTGILVTLTDYIVPILISKFLRTQWSSQKEQEFEDMCVNLVIYKTRLELLWSSYRQLKLSNRKMYCFLTVTVLSILTWIGCTFDNLFLTYIAVTFLSLLPGMEHNGVVNKSFGALINTIVKNLEQAKSSIMDEKKSK